jgi:drug/metabolite transporter (DMT)-like permease
MFRSKPAHKQAVILAIFVTFLWSTSWVLIKIGLEDIPALTFAGMRYSLALIFLAPWFFRKENIQSIGKIPQGTWVRLILLGIVFYFLTQGAQFLGLSLLPAVTVNLLLSFTTIVVASFGQVLLAEKTTNRQWVGVALSLIGALIYFTPVEFIPGRILGYGIVTIGVFANAGSGILARSINKTGETSPLIVTFVSMVFGCILLLGTGLAVEEWPTIDLEGWLILGWLAAVNTAFAFTLWNRTLHILSAVESSIINTTMLIQIPIMAIIFLGERITGRELVGMIIVGLGVLIVQLKSNSKNVDI